jgi:photoactive yellow protein
MTQQTDPEDSEALPTFETPHLAQCVERLPPDRINALPFGAIRLDQDNNVAFYNDTERRLSGYRKEVLNHKFFTEIAPCMNNPAFRGRIDRALAAGTLDIKFDQIGDFEDDTRLIRVRVQSASGGGCWIFLLRED